jgi:hypothetical protein
MKRVDSNQQQIVRNLRAIGASVQSLAEIGKGAPDLLVGAQGKNWLFEIKSPDQPPSKRRLTPDEARWHSDWRGQIHTVENFSEVLEVLGLAV